jgi:predicted metal-dependent phosphoesterase TrpH
MEECNFFAMKIDFHIHSGDCSDGRLSLQEIFEEAARRRLSFISITDHDCLDCQEPARALAERYAIQYLYGIELNVSFTYPGYKNAKPVSLDFLGYNYDISYRPLIDKLKSLSEYRRGRARKILHRINEELGRENLEPLTGEDLQAIQNSVDGSFGRPHIARYMVKKGIVRTTQEAFDRYLVRCDVPKMPLSLPEASGLVRGAGGKLILAHPNDPNGTSLASLSASLEEQQTVIRNGILPYIDGIECWHPRHDPNTVESYRAFAEENHLLVTGGSDCHQQPVILGTVDVPAYVAYQFFERAR